MKKIMREMKKPKEMKNIIREKMNKQKNNRKCRKS